LDADIMRALLEGVRAGTVTPDAAVAAMRNLPFEELGFAKVDHHRAVRKGFPEVIFCQGKTADQVGEIAHSLHRAGSTLLATRADAAAFEAVRARVPVAQYRETGDSFSHRAAKASLCRAPWASSRRARAIFPLPKKPPAHSK
jgi:NCAIR mutase (PurE)-related protein